jgi:ketosteroid isomerase-like protein
MENEQPNAFTKSTNLDVVRQWYAAAAQGDFSTLHALMDSQLEYHDAEGLPFGGLYVGRETVLDQMMPTVMQGFEWFRIEPEQFFEAGHEVITTGRYRGKTIDTQRELNAQFAHIWSVQDHKITRLLQYTNTLAFFRALGEAAAQQIEAQTRPFRTS